MKVDFEDLDLKELIRTGSNNKYKKYSKDKRFMDALLGVYQRIMSVDTASELKSFSPLHYEPLKYQYSGKHSIRIMNGRVERLIVEEKEEGLLLIILEMEDNHYGNKH